MPAEALAGANLEAQQLAANAMTGEEGTPTGERAPRARRERGERGERGERSADRGERNLNGDAPRSEAAAGEDGNAAQGERTERAPRNGREERGPRGERNDGRRERRNDGQPRFNEEGEAAPTASADAEAGREAAPQDGAEQAPRRDGEERRGRSRDRYGRDRRERAPREEGEAQQPVAAFDGAPAEAQNLQVARQPQPSAEQAVAQAADSVAVVAEAPVAAPQVREPAPPARFEQPQQPAAPAAPIVVERASAPQPAANGRALPKVQSFELPLDELAQIAQSSGLQWVNSDAERIAQARAAIAAEPKPVHVPRERPPVIVLDEGPLVLVETRRELAAMTLPFEQPAGEAQPEQRAL